MTNKYKPGQKVDLVILRKTDLGYVAEINREDEGLLYHNEVFQGLEPRQSIAGYIKAVREDGGIDLLLQPFGNQGADELGLRIIVALEDNNGFLPINDKTSAEVIYDYFGVSKKKYKIAIGNLYKKRIILITEQGLKLVADAKNNSK